MSALRMRPVAEPGRGRTRMAARMSAAAILLAPVSAVLIVGLPSTGYAAVSYTGHADAKSFQTTVTNDALPLGLLIEGDAPIARADQSSLGDSSALAAGPYPGDTIANTPGALGGIYGVPLPNYPLVAATSAGDAPQERNVPGISLRAESGSVKTDGFATVGTGAQGATTEASVTNEPDNGVTATADSRMEAVALLNLVHLGRVESTATTVLDTSGNRTSTTSLRIDGIAATGLQLTLPATTPGTLPIPQPVPGLPQLPVLHFPTLPVPLGGSALSGPELSFKDGQFAVSLGVAGTSQQVPVSFDSVATAFKALGVTITYQAPQKLDSGVVGAELSISTELPSPPSNPFGVTGKTPVTLTFGGATATVAGQALPDPTVGSGNIAPTSTGTAGSSGAGSGSNGATTGSGTTSGGASTPDLGGTPALADPGSLTTSSTAGTDIPSVAAPQIAAATQQSTGTALTAFNTKHFKDLYPVFVVVALLVILSSGVLQLLGMRFRWDS